MTSSRDVAAIDALPPALSSMWRLCKLGYRHEPALIVTAFALSLLAAVPDALLALWFKLIGEGVLAGRLDPRPVGSAGDRRVGHRDLVPRHRQHARAAPLPRQGDHRARVARGHAAGLDLHHRPSRASRLSRSPLGAAQPGLHARSHVHVAVHDVWLDPAPGRHDRAARLDSSGAGAARALRPAAGLHLHVAAGRRAGRVRARSRSGAAGPSPVRRRDHGLAGERSAGDRDRGSPDHRAAPDLGVREREDRRGAMGVRRLARAGLGRLRRRVRGRHRLRRVGARGSGRRRGPRARRRLAPLVLRRRHGRRGRLPARHLDGLRAATRLARGLRRLAGRGRRSAVSLAPGARDSLRRRLVRLSRHHAAGARRRRSRAARGQGDRDRRRERRRQVHPGQAAGQDVPADPRSHHRGRHRPWPHRRPRTGAAGWPVRSRTSSVSSSRPVTRSASAISLVWTIGRRSRPRSGEPVPTT